MLKGHDMQHMLLCCSRHMLLKHLPACSMSCALCSYAAQGTYMLLNHISHHMSLSPSSLLPLSSCPFYVPSHTCPRPYIQTRICARARTHTHTHEWMRQVLPPHIASVVGSLDDRKYVADAHVPTTMEHTIKVHMSQPQTHPKPHPT